MHAQTGAEVRPFRPDDRDGFLDLYEAVWGTRKSQEWFRWRFEHAPLVDEVPMVVAEDDGEIVGAEACLTVRLQIGSTTVLAFQPADWMVHPAHRRQGVFTRMTERLLARYDDGPPDLYYNFPSEAIRPGLLSQGWRVVGSLSTYYRVQDLSALATNVLSGETSTARLAAALGATGKPVIRRVQSLRDRITAEGDEWEITRHDEVPAGTLVSLYRSSVPERIHVRRDGPFYRWRVANPRWDAVTYVAWDDGGPVASLVAATSASDDLRKVSVLDVLPADGSGPRGAVAALLEAVLADARDADVVKCAGEAIPSGVLRRHGFRADDSLPLSVVSKATTAVVRPAAADAPDGPWHVDGVDLTDRANWSVQLCGQDIA